MSLSYNYEYDPSTGNYTRKASMPTPRANFGIAVYQNKIYVIGDYGASLANEVYDPATDTWETKTHMPTGRTCLTASVVDGKIHLFSREGHDVYDIATDSWTAGSETPYQVNPKSWQGINFRSVVIDDKIYIMRYNRTDIYDPKSDTWSLGAVSPVAVNAAAVCATTGVMAPKRIYVIGGSPEFLYYTDTTQVYDPVSDTWVLGEPMPTARAGAAFAVVDDQIYVIGGGFGMYGNSYANEQYTPFGYGTIPVITVASPENQTYNASSVSLVFTVDKSATWLGYSLDGQDNVTVTGNFTLTGLSSSLHNVTVYANDTLGNMGASETISFNVKVPFPTALVAAASLVSIGIIAVGLLVYLKKRKR